MLITGATTQRSWTLIKVTMARGFRKHGETWAAGSCWLCDYREEDHALRGSLPIWRGRRTGTHFSHRIAMHWASSRTSSSTRVLIFRCFDHRSWTEAVCWYHPRTLVRLPDPKQWQSNEEAVLRSLIWEKDTSLTYLLSSCMNLTVRSLFGKLLFQILKIESCLHVDTLGVLVWFKCVRIYEYRYMYAYQHLQVWVPSLKKP